MQKKKPYATVNVKDVDLSELIQARPEGDLAVGIDVSKEFVIVALCWGRGDFSRPWRCASPDQLPLLASQLKLLAGNRRMIVALEPTGTYGDPLRWALCQAGLSTHKVDCKTSHDYAEVFDKTPSQHDAKDAMIVAELALIGKSSPWPFLQADHRQEQMAAWVDQAEDQQRVLGIFTGRLEALLSRHWPEATRVLDLGSMTLLKVLLEYGGPQGLGEDANAEQQLRDWGGAFLAEEKIKALIQGARTTAGVPASAAEIKRISSYAGEAIKAARSLRQSHRELEKLAENDPALELMGKAVGKATACVLYVKLGDPQNYGSDQAYLKAAGLNLAERSSGKYLGQLKLSKRGPSMVRKWLYMSAIRSLKEPWVHEWWQRKRDRDNGRTTGPLRKGLSIKATVGVMRRLLRAVWHVRTKGISFDAKRLFGSGRAQSPPGKPAASAQRAVLNGSSK